MQVPSKEVRPSADIGDIAWDPIVLIEAVGREPVYDIEVEGTHHFVANGLIAHNTYLKGATADNTAAALNAVSSGATSLL
jgi:hypothetical protein